MLLFRYIPVQLLMNKEVQRLYVWVIAGKQRRAILKVLDKPLTATLIKEKTEIKVTNISDILREMVKLRMAKVLNPKDKRNRVYVLMKIGEDVAKEISKI